MISDKSKPAIFLDRDGTIIKEVGYIDSPEKISLIPRADEAIRSLQESGFKIIVVSNQSGVAHGYFDEDTVRLINERVSDIFASKSAVIDAFYFCPHHPDFGNQDYKKDCECRKPKPGMILQAVEEHRIDLSNSIMIGDKFTDVKTGKNLNLLSILVLTGFGTKEYQTIKAMGLQPEPDFVAENIYEAALIIKKKLED